MSPHVIMTIYEFHDALNDRNNWFTVLRVAASVLDRLTTKDYEDMSRHGIIIWKVNI